MVEMIQIIYHLQQLSNLSTNKIKHISVIQNKTHFKYGLNIDNFFTNIGMTNSFSNSIPSLHLHTN